MPEPTLPIALRESVVEVLEKMFFISAFEEPPGEPQPSGPDVAVQLTFEGDPPGSLTLYTSRAVGRSIAADFLGEDLTALPEEQVDEVLCELANMICGAVLSRVESRTLFRLGTPRILPVPENLDDDGLPEAGTDHAAETGAAPAGTKVRLAEIGGGCLLVKVHTERPACTVVERYAF